MDAYYRIAILLMFVPTMVIAGYHRWQARKSGENEKFDRRQEGLLLAVVLRLVGLAMWITLVTYLVHPPAMAWASLPLPAWLRWCGAVLAAAGVALMYWTLTNLGKNLTDTVSTRRDATLVTSGPYRFVRHPFYVTAALLIAAASLLAANWLILALGVLMMSLLIVRTTKEEEMLVAKFGDQYRDYMARTGRFVPRFGR